MPRVFSTGTVAFERPSRPRTPSAWAAAEVKITAGYTANVVGFGWTNGVYLKLHALLDGAGKPAEAAAATK